jgi:hypothetical protein
MELASRTGAHKRIIMQRQNPRIQRPARGIGQLHMEDVFAQIAHGGLDRPGTHGQNSVVVRMGKSEIGRVADFIEIHGEKAMM